MSLNFEERLSVAGKFVEGGGERLDVISPATKKTVASVHPAWANGDPSVRAKALNKLADLVEENAIILGMAQTVEMGKPINESISEIHLAKCFLRYFAGFADKINGKTSINVPGFLGLEIRQPYGVTAGILPWNGPIIMLVIKVSPSLAAGNAMIIKTSEKSPLSGLLFAGLVKQAGIPDGVLSILSGAGETGQRLASHMRIRKIAFTGSVSTGRAVMQAAAASNLKSCTLELGGKSPTSDSANFRVQMSFTYNAGQVCISGTRIYVQDTIFEEFQKRLVDGLKNLTLGDPTDMESTMGPQVDLFQYNRIMRYLDIGKKEGRVLIGGGGLDENTYYVRPTLFTDVPDKAIVNQEEIFGPVNVLHKFKTEEVMKRANDTEYGLAAYVFTQDISRAVRLAKGLEAGTIGVNSTMMLHPDLGFGGWKTSGVGCELGHHSIDQYTEVKSIFIR